MISPSDASSGLPLVIAGMGLLGLILSASAEALIARFLPRLGELPAIRIRIVTATLTALLCCGFALRLSNDPALPAFILLAALGIQLARIDLLLHLLPNPLVLALLVMGFSLFASSTLAGSPWSDILRGAAGGAILFVSYLILALVSPGSVGLGDVKLAAPVGLYLGYLGWPHLLYGALLGLVLNGIFALFLHVRTAPKPAIEVAHGPSMIAAVAVIALFAS